MSIRAAMVICIIVIAMAAIEIWLGICEINAGENFGWFWIAMGIYWGARFTTHLRRMYAAESKDRA